MKRKRNLDEKIIREGDKVRIINPEFFLRCGYDNDHKSACAFIEETFGNKILQFIYEFEKFEHDSYKTPTDSKWKTAFIDFARYQQELMNPKSYSKIISALAYDHVKRMQKSGTERKIYTERLENELGVIRTVTNIFFCKTGKYDPPSTTQDYSTGEYDFIPGGLLKEKTHKILHLSGLIISLREYGDEDEINCIETCNVEKVIFNQETREYKKTQDEEEENYCWSPQTTQYQNIILPKTYLHQRKE